MRFPHIQKEQWNIRLLIILGVVVVFVLGTVWAMSNMKYRGFEVISQKEGLTDGAMQYAHLRNRVFRYSGEGISLLNEELDAVWTQALDYASPFVLEGEQYVAIYDKQGVSVSLFDLEGMVSSFQTDAPIVRATLGRGGQVALIVRNEEQLMAQYYLMDGTKVADVVGDEMKDGYPVDVEISDDGRIMGVTYIGASEEGINGTLAVYSFEDKKDVSDPLLYRETFDGRIAPDMVMSGSRMALLLEKGVIVYRLGSSVTKETNLTFDQEIVSAVYDDEALAFVFRNNNGEEPYRLQVYDFAGKQMMDAGIDLLYRDVVLSDGYIVFSNDTEMALYTSRGALRYRGILDENGVDHVLRLSRNRFLVTSTTKTEIIQLKFLDSHNS